MNPGQLCVDPIYSPCAHLRCVRRYPNLTPAKWVPAASGYRMAVRIGRNTAPACIDKFETSWKRKFFRLSGGRGGVSLVVGEGDPSSNAWWVLRWGSKSSWWTKGESRWVSKGRCKDLGVLAGGYSIVAEQDIRWVASPHPRNTFPLRNHGGGKEHA